MLKIVGFLVITVSLSLNRDWIIKIKMVMKYQLLNFRRINSPVIIILIVLILHPSIRLKSRYPKRLKINEFLNVFIYMIEKNRLFMAKVY